MKEILFPSYDGKVHAYWLDKTEHGSWPYVVPASGSPGDEFRFAGEPVVADVDNDGQAEVLFTSWPKKTSAIGTVGQSMGWSQTVAAPFQVSELKPQTLARGPTPWRP